MLGHQDVLIPQRGEDRRHRRLADVAAAALAVGDEGCVEALDAPDLDEVEQALARVREVLAEVVVHREAACLELGIEYLLHQGRAAAAGGARLGAFLQRADGGIARVDCRAERTLADVVAGANDRTRRQQIDAQAFLRTTFAGRQDEVFRVLRQRDGVERELQEIAVVLGIAHQHRAEQCLAAGTDDVLLVDARHLVAEDVVERGGIGGMGIADARHIHAHQLELGGHVRAEEGRVVVARNRLRRDLRHLVAGCDQAVDLFLPQRTFPDGVDACVGGAAVVVDADAAAFAHRQP